MASQTRTRPWALHGGMEGSFNRAELLRIDGTKDTFTLVTGACAKRGDVFRMITGTGGGYGDPKLRPIEAVRRDLRDGYITKAQATSDCPQLRSEERSVGKESVR